MSRNAIVAAAAVSASAAVLLFGACSSTSANSRDSAQASEPLWSMLGVAADYEIADNVDRLIAGTGTEHVIRGVVIGAEPGAVYTFGEGDTFESAFLTLDVSESDIPGIETAVVEVQKPESVTASELRSATFSDQQVVFVVKSAPLYDTESVSDLDSEPDPEMIHSVASTVQGALVFDDGSVISLFTGDEVLAESDASSVNQLGDEIASALT